MSAATPQTGQRVGLLLLAVLLAIVLLHVAADVLGYLRAIGYPFGLDYGEGIVWQQLLLIPGPHMYGTSMDLPFIVFHYPPLYHLIVRLVSGIMPDMLSAGRLVSSVSTWLIAPLAAGLILAAARPTDGPRRFAYRAIAITIGLLTLSLDPVRQWGVFMRVDMLAIALSMAGVLVAARCDGSILGTAAALLLCVASVFGKQTEIPAGAAIFLITLLRRPRAALIGGAIAFAIALAALAWLELATHGGFLLHILLYNINRLEIERAVWLVRHERYLAPFIVVMGIAGLAVIADVDARSPGGRRRGVVGRLLAGVRRADRAGAARAMLVLYFALSTLMLVTVLKSGGAINYLIEWLCVGSVLVGVLLCDLMPRGRTFAAVVAVLILGVLPMPFDWAFLHAPQQAIAAQEALVRRIAAADKPVASEDMTLLMRAGKPVIFEPSIVTELASVGRWDETPLIRMIRDGGFAFMITTNNVPSDHARRTPAVDAAMRAAYPRVEETAPGLWIHLPPRAVD